MTAKRRHSWLRTLFLPHDATAAETSEKTRLLSQLRAEELALTLRKENLKVRLGRAPCPSCSEVVSVYARVCPRCARPLRATGTTVPQELPER